MFRHMFKAELVTLRQLKGPVGPCLFFLPGLNSVTLLGRVGVDPQLRGTDRHPVVAFSLATNLRYRPDGQQDYVTKTDWHNVAVFRYNFGPSCTLRNILLFLKKKKKNPHGLPPLLQALFA